MAVADSHLTPIARELLAVLLDETGHIADEAITAVIAQRSTDPNVTAEERERLPAAAGLISR